MSTVVIDPITRIEGHLRIEAETDNSGKVTKASASGTMVRGIEIILKGRDPREAWAFTQRICGVCTVVHALTSVRAVEDALGYSIPTNARHIRNLMMGTQLVQDHVSHFYQLASMDWVNVVSASQADPNATSRLQKCVSDWHNNSPEYFEAVRQKLAGFIASGQLGLFGNAYFDHPAYKLPPEMNLMLFAHWLEALEWQRKVLRVHTVFGGRNPHPNFAIGGVPTAIHMAPNAAGILMPSPGQEGLDQAGLDLVQSCITEMREFVSKVYRPDVIALAGHYKDWFRRGEGLGNFLTFGEYPQDDNADVSSNLFVPRGAIVGRNIRNIQPVDLRNPNEVQEFVSHSWYDYAAGKDAGLHPFQGETMLNYTGPQANYRNLDVEQSYSWVKAPRWKGKPMEVGPLARMLVAYASGHQTVKELIDNALKTLDVPIEALFSTLGRTLARGMETLVLAERIIDWTDELAGNMGRGELQIHAGEKWDPSEWPPEAMGYGLYEAPRGALGHWIHIKDKSIHNYQCVVPSTWNLGPRDARGQAGPVEKALIGTPVADPAQPLEILRTVHSFDPCMACGVHIYDTAGREMNFVKIG